MVRELLEVGLLLVELLSQLEEPLPLALADGHVLASLLAAREGIAIGEGPSAKVYQAAKDVGPGAIGPLVREG